MLIRYTKNKKINLFILSIIFVLSFSPVSASIYKNQNNKTNFILDPSKLQLDFQNYNGVGGLDKRITEKGVVTPSDFLFEIEEDQKTVVDVKPKDNIQYYIVQKGDNVAKIAKKFGVSQKTIILENKLNSRGFLKLKQKLTILPVSGVTYNVKKGDNLLSISKKFKVSIDKIKTFNELKTNNLSIGQKLIIPGGDKVSFPVRKVVKKTYSSKRTYTKSKSTLKVSKNKLSKIFIRPSFGRATSPYGRRWGRMHWGVDFSQGRNAPIIAAASGKVIKVYSGCRVGNDHCGGGFGNNILIQHSNGYTTRYAHLHSINVVKGAYVKQGQIIGGMGNTGHVWPKPRSSRSTSGTHLHFEIMKNGKHINPNFLR